MKPLTRSMVLLALAAAGAPALAHPGQALDSWFAGLAHPFGLDHLLAAAAVGLWAAAALPAGRRLVAPLLFLGAMLGGAALASVGVGGHSVEWLLALAVVACGALLVAPRAWPPAAALAVLASVAVLQGLAHGAELPADASAWRYAAGLVLATLALQLAALGAGLGLRARLLAWRVLGSGFGAAGLWLLAQA